MGNWNSQDGYRFITYQDDALATAVFPEAHALEYLTLGLAGEAGEVAGKVKKWFREDGDLERDKIIDELGDVLWYITLLANHFGCDLGEVAYRNAEKLRDRMARGVIKGDGDNR